MPQETEKVSSAALSPQTKMRHLLGPPFVIHDRVWRFSSEDVPYI